MTASVFITGANGFIAQHTTQLLLSQGYAVVGSVRSIEKGENLRKLFRSDFFSYEVVPSLVAEEAFEVVLQKHPEVTAFLHTASPVTFNSANVESDMLSPAVEGTKNVLDAIVKFGPQIKNVVITSSVAAMVSVENMKNPSFSVNEESWNTASWEESRTNASAAYSYSKTAAEKAAWDFMDSEKPDFFLNVVCPVYVFGPQAFDSEVKDELNSSAEKINRIFKLQSHMALPLGDGLFVDVRDVARAHLVAFTSDFRNERLILSTEDFTSQKILDIINDAFSELRGRLPRGAPGMRDAADICTFDNAKSRELLDFPQMDLTTSVVDAVAQLSRVDRVKRRFLIGNGSDKTL